MVLNRAGDAFAQQILWPLGRVRLLQGGTIYIVGFPFTQRNTLFYVYDVLPVCVGVPWVCMQYHKGQ